MITTAEKLLGCYNGFMFKLSKSIIIGFFVGPIVATYLVMITGAWFLTAPGAYLSKPYMTQTPTSILLSVDGIGRPVALSETQKKYIADHPVSPQANAIMWTVFFIVNGICYAILFWLVSFIFRKKSQTKIIS